MGPSCPAAACKLDAIAWNSAHRVAGVNGGYFASRQSDQTTRSVNQFTSNFRDSCSCSILRDSGDHEMTYDGFEIESFEIGRGLWHARIRRADLNPVIIDGVSFPTLEMGFAWPNP